MRKGTLKKEEGRMVQLPSVELLEAAHRFPGPYMFKVIGRTENGFAARAVAAVREEVAAEVDPPFRLRETPGGRHVAVTLELTMQTAEQVRDVYRRLLKLTGLVVLW
jgi:putative lipoic acid-binding regulatory protein